MSKTEAHRDTFGDLTTLPDWLRDKGLAVPEHGYLDSELRMAHRQLEDALNDVVERGTELLGLVRSADVYDVWHAIVRMDHGAGASGPIDTRYMKAVSQATRIAALISGFRSGVASTRD